MTFLFLSFSPHVSFCGTCSEVPSTSLSCTILRSSLVHVVAFPELGAWLLRKNTFFTGVAWRFSLTGTSISAMAQNFVGPQVNHDHCSRITSTRCASPFFCVDLCVLLARAPPVSIPPPSSTYCSSSLSTAPVPSLFSCLPHLSARSSWFLAVSPQSTHLPRVTQRSCVPTIFDILPGLCLTAARFHITLDLFLAFGFPVSTSSSLLTYLLFCLIKAPLATVCSINSSMTEGANSCS